MPTVTVNSTYVPALPNTGFEPWSADGFAFTAVLLIAAAAFVLPYVRRTITAIFR